MLKLLSVLFLASILTACGNGSDGNQQAVGTYGYTQNGIAGQGGLCPQQVVQDWNQLVAVACSTPGQNGQNSPYCVRGLQAFVQRDDAYIQGAGCSIPSAQLQWCPGVRGQQTTFVVSQTSLQTMLTNGGSAYPVYNQQQGYAVQPGQVGQGYPNQNGF